MSPSGCHFCKRVPARLPVSVILVTTWVAFPWYLQLSSTSPATSRRRQFLSAALEGPVSHGIFTVTFCFLLHLAFSFVTCVNQDCAGCSPSPAASSPAAGTVSCPHPPCTWQPGGRWLWLRFWGTTRCFVLWTLCSVRVSCRGRATMKTSSVSPAPLPCSSVSGSSGAVAFQMCRAQEFGHCVTILTSAIHPLLGVRPPPPMLVPSLFPALTALPLADVSHLPQLILISLPCAARSRAQRSGTRWGCAPVPRSSKCWGGCAGGNGRRRKCGLSLPEHGPCNGEQQPRGQPCGDAARGWG